MLGALRRGAAGARWAAAQLQQQRFLNVHEYQVGGGGAARAVHPPIADPHE